MKKHTINDFFDIQGPAKSLESNVTSGWAKNDEWDIVTISRDLYQNFFDSCRSNEIPISKIIKEEINGNCFKLGSPVVFDLNQLFWLGSEKDHETNIGQVGEGFKLAVKCLLTSHNVKIFTGSGNKALEIKLSELPAAGSTSLYPLIYDFYDLEVPIDGNILYITGAKPELIKGLKEGHLNFYYDEHPGIGELLNSKRQISIFKRVPLVGESDKESQTGLLFYNSLLRVRLPNTPVVIVFNQLYANVDKKIGIDRDRKVFDDTVRNMLIRIVAKSAFDLEGYGRATTGDLTWLIPLMKNHLRKGNTLLGQVSARISDYGLIGESRWVKNNECFASNFEGMFASTPNQLMNQTNVNDIMAIESRWEVEGKIKIPAYFVNFGAESALIEIRNLKIKNEKEIKTKGSRQPTTKELNMIHFVISFFPEVLNNKKFTYLIFNNETLLGQFRSGRAYNSKDVYLGRSIFQGTPGEFFSVLIHEILHLHGHDSDHRFSGALTEFISKLFDSPEAVQSLHAELELLMKEIQSESDNVNITSNEIERLVKNKDPEELARIVSLIPHGVMAEILSKVQ